MKGLGSLSKSLEELGRFTSELDGEVKASDILNEVRQKNPPFIISNGFPEGMLPKINNIK